MNDLYKNCHLLSLTRSNTLTKILILSLQSGIIPDCSTYDQHFLIIVKIYAMLFRNNSIAKGTK